MTEAPDRSALDGPTEAEINERLNDLLSRWHAHCTGYQAGKGYPSGDAICRQADTTSAWDWWNGSVDKEVDRKIMEAFDAAIWTIPQPHLTALQFQAKNLHTGKQVWRSLRLPQDDRQRMALLIEARAMLRKVLANRGIL